MSDSNIGSPEALLKWSLDIRGPECLVVENDTKRPTELDIWSKEPLEVPDGVHVIASLADGTAPAMEDRDVEGWHRYVLTLSDSDEDVVETTGTSSGMPMTIRRSVAWEDEDR